MLRRRRLMGTRVWCWTAGVRPSTSGRVRSSSSVKAGRGSRRCRTSATGFDMCGIAGILKFDARRTVETARLDRMRNVLRHRGPDAEGIMVRGRTGFVHSRLSIIDLDGGQQPMADSTGRIWISYNGEIYNFRQLRTELIS